MNIYFDHERPRQCPGFATSSAIVRLSPKMRILNVHPSLCVSEVSCSLLSAEATRTRSLAFERPHLTRTSLPRSEAAQLASGLIPSHGTQTCLVLSSGSLPALRKSCLPLVVVSIQLLFADTALRVLSCVPMKFTANDPSVRVVEV